MLCCRFIWPCLLGPLTSALRSGGGGRSGYAALLLSCCKTAEKPEPIAGVSTADRCFVCRGDDGGDDDNDDDELLVCALAGFGCCVLLPEPVFCVSFLCMGSSVVSDNGDNKLAAVAHELPL